MTFSHASLLYLTLACATGLFILAPSPTATPTLSPQKKALYSHDLKALHHLTAVTLTLSSEGHPRSTLDVKDLQIKEQGAVLLSGGFQWQGLWRDHPHTASSKPQDLGFLARAMKDIPFRFGAQELALTLAETSPSEGESLQQIGEIPLSGLRVQNLKVHGDVSMSIGAGQINAQALSYDSNTLKLSMTGAVELALGEHVLSLSQGFFLEAGEARRWISTVKFLWPF